MALHVLLAILSLNKVVHAIYTPTHEFSGTTFFDGWNFAGSIDNTTWGACKPLYTLQLFILLPGNVTFVDKSLATSDRLAYVNSAGNAILRVDNVTDVTLNEDRLAYRNSVSRNMMWRITMGESFLIAIQVKITTQDAYPLGSLITVDILHMPVGCSVSDIELGLHLQLIEAFSNSIGMASSLDTRRRR